MRPLFWSPPSVSSISAAAVISESIFLLLLRRRPRQFRIKTMDCTQLKTGEGGGGQFFFVSNRLLFGTGLYERTRTVLTSVKFPSSTFFFFFFSLWFRFCYVMEEKMKENV